MINPINSYNISFASKQNLTRKLVSKASPKITREIVSVKDSSLKGITKSPIRFDLLDFDNREIPYFIAGISSGFLALGTVSSIGQESTVSSVMGAM